VALEAVYTAVDVEAAEAALAGFEETDPAARCPAIAPGWRRAWPEVIPFLDYPPEVRRLICTTKAIEALNSKIRRAVRTRGHFTGDDAAAKLVYLAFNAASKEWKLSVRGTPSATGTPSKAGSPSCARIASPWRKLHATAQNFRQSRWPGSIGRFPISARSVVVRKTLPLSCLAALRPDRCIS